MRLCVGKLHGSIGAAHDAINDRQSQSCAGCAAAGCIAALKRPHEAIGLAHVQPRALIAYREHGFVFFSENFHRQVQNAVIALAVAQGIGDEVLHDA